MAATKVKTNRMKMPRWHKKSKSLTIPMDGILYSSNEELSDFGDVLQNPSLVRQERYTYTPEGHTPEGHTPEGRTPEGHTPERQSPELELEEDKPNKISETGFLLQLTLMSGHNLAVRDRSGTSDPYVKIKHPNYKNRSSVVNRNLNPVWNEEFRFKVYDLSLPIEIKVYDHDYASSDDFMGRGRIYLDDQQQGDVIQIDVGLDDPQPIGEDLGYLRFSLRIIPLSDQKLIEQLHLTNPTEEMKHVKKPGRVWKSVVTITLLEAKGLPAMDPNGFSDPYCKFKLGVQKYKSRVQPKTLNPEWKERFEMKLYEGEPTSLHVEVWDKDFLASDDYIGHCKLDLSSYKPQKQYDLVMNLEDNPGTLHLLLVISGIPAKECDKSEHLISDALDKFHYKKSFNIKNIKDVGMLRVTIMGAKGLHTSGGRCNPYVTVEVGQARLRTQALHNETSPQWDKTFYFHIKDIHDWIHVVVGNDGRGKEDQLGQVMIPLLRVESGEIKEYRLKDKECLHRTSGIITVQCDLVYNHFRAGVRTLRPRETSVLDQDARFQRKVLLYNIKRLMTFLNPFLRAVQFYQTILSWEDKLLSTFILILYIISCLYAELWMLFIAIIIVFIVFYVSVFIYGRDKEIYSIAKSRSAEATRSDSDDISDEDFLEDDTTKEKRKSFQAKLRQLHNLLLLVQTTSEYIADMCERTKNFFQWSVPFLCWLAMILCMIAAVITYIIPLRYILLIIGFNKLTKRLRKPNHITNYELLDFISRSPTNLQLVKFKEISIFNYEKNK